MNINLKLNYFKVPLKFLSLSKKYSILYFFLSVLSGLLQTLSVFAIYPVLLKLKLFQLDDVGSTFVYFYKNFYLDIFYLKDTYVSVFIFFIFLITLSSFINLYIKISSIRIATKLTENIRLDYIKSTLEANWSYFVTKKTGEIVNTVMNESGKTINGFVDTVYFLSSIVQFFILFIFVFFVSNLVGLYSIFVGVIYLLVFRIWGRRAKKYGFIATKLLKNISNSIFEGFKNIKTIKITGFSDIFFNNLKDIVSSTKKNDIRLFETTAYPESLKEPFFAIFISIGLISAFTYDIVAFSSLVTLLALFQRAMSKLSTSFNLYLTVKKMEPFYDSYFNNLKYVRKFFVIKKNNFDFDFKNNISFNDVSFKYKNEYVLKNISVTFKKESFITIFGKSGSGKTTMIDLILNLLEPSSGSILVDNKDIKNINIVKWRSLVGCVTQDHYFFNDSVYNNLILGSKCNDSELIKILDISLCGDFVKSIDDTKNTFMGESGSKFSGGQKQRLSIARALLRKPEILIFDEATSGLDKENEKKLLYNLKNKLDYNPTIIFITHNEDIIKYADYSYCIKDNQLYSMKNEIEK